jgi:hypothetical protein
LAAAGSGLSDAARLAVEAPAPPQQEGSGARQLAEVLLKIAAEIDTRRATPRPDARC